MKRTRHFLIVSLGLIGLMVLAWACVKDTDATPTRPGPVFPVQSASFVEEFDSVGRLTAKGWVLRNNSNPIGQTGWRQGRYESAVQQQYKFLGPVAYLGFPAYSANASPNDFISCDASAVNDAVTGSGEISAWLISPRVPMSNGDRIIFYTRSVDDALYGWYSKDRMQVRANFTDGTANVGSSPVDVGSFSNLLLDINPNYIYNDPGGNTGGAVGFPRQWTKYTITISGLTAPVQNARFAFRYLGTDAGVFGGSAADNYPSVVGVDSLAFVHN